MTDTTKAIIEPERPETETDRKLALLRYWHRRRCFAMEARKRINLALGSFLRLQLGWRLGLPKDQSDAIKKRAKEIAALKCPDHDCHSIAVATARSRDPFETIEKEATKEMETLVGELLIWDQWGAEIPGLGKLGVGIILAETGNPAIYSNYAKFWKRCGLAVIDGIRQGGLPKSAPKELWIIHGYNRLRRSRIWTIGHSMSRQRGPYREIYLARKARENEKAAEEGLTVAPSAKIPAKRQAEFRSLGHIDRRAQRYMEKKLLRKMWKAWRHYMREEPLKIAA